MLTVASCARHQVDPAPTPLVEAPETYSVEPPAPEEPLEAWWLAFSDPTLNDLIDTALAQNVTVAQALERIDRAEALLRQAKAIRKPQVDVTADVERTWERSRLKDDGIGTAEKVDDAVESFNDFLSSVEAYRDAISSLAGGGGDGEGGGGRENLPDLRRPESTGPPKGWVEDYETEFSSGLSLSWEADVWGRLRSAARAQAEEYAAAVEDYEALRLILTSQVAEAYYLAVEQRLQYELLLEQRESAETLLELIELRFLQGSASVVDVLQQKGQLAEIDAEVPVVHSQLRIFENRLDVLLGVAPDGADRTPETEPNLPRETALPSVGVPVTLLQNRPDLRALRRRVVAADYRIASAIAERLPRLTLTGALEYGDTSLASTLTATGAAGLFQPLLDWGLRKAAVDEARSDFREALLEYTYGYLLAIEEVESALWREARQRDLIEALAAREAILQQTLDETRVRYGLGVTDYLPVLTAIQDLQDVQRELLTERRALVSLRIEINRAIGGTVPAEPGAVRTANERPEAGNPAAGNGV
ncbi:MAG: TolC family protein [Candidatus Hydrogenedentes bacterium]|nr:TolC family protein [Candidatus Hydrogenedentota bacterium]